MKNLKLLLISILIFSISKVVLSQSKCDSIEKVMEKALMSGQYKTVFKLVDSFRITCYEDKGATSLSYISALTACSMAYLNSNKTDEALKLLNEADSVFLGNYQEDHPDYGSILSGFYAIYLFKGDYEKALFYLDKSLINAEKNTGKNDFKYGSRLGTKVTVLMELGRNEEALQSAREALEIIENTNGQDNFYYIAFANNLGFLQSYAGLYNEAISTLESALKNVISLFDENHYMYGVVITNLGRTYAMMGNYVLAKKTLLNAIEILEKNEYNIQLIKYKAIAYNNLANTYMEMGLFDDALIIYEKSLLIFEKVFGKKHPDLVTIYLNIGQIYSVKGEIYKALPYLHQCNDMINSNPEWKRTNFSQLYTILASDYRDLGQIQKALDYVEQGKNMLADFDKGKTDHLLLLNQADLLYMMNRNDEAEQVNLHALKIIRESFGENHYLNAQAMSLLSNFYRNIKKYKYALKYLNKSIGIFETTIGKDHPEYIKTLANIGMIFLDKKDFKNSEKYLRLALDSRSESIGNNHPDLIEIYNGLAKIEENDGNFQSALNYYTEARKIILYQLNNNFAVLSENGKSGFLEKFRPYFSNFHSFLIANKSNLPKAESLIYDDILAMKGSLLTSSKYVFESIRSSGDSVLLNNYGQWKSLRQLIAKQQSLEKSVRQYDSSSLDSLIQLSDFIEQKLTMNSSQFRQAITPVVEKNVKDGLLPDEAVVEFFTIDNQEKEDKNRAKYYAIVVRNDAAITQIVPLFDEQQLLSLLNYDNSNIEDYLYWVYNTGKNNAAISLYQLIWQPLEEKLKSVKKVYYSPTGLLHRIAFAAIEKQKGVSLIDLFDMNYISSGKDIVFKDNSFSSGIKTALIAGGIKYETDSLQMAQNKIINADYYSFSQSDQMNSGQLADNIKSDSLNADLDHSFAMERGNIGFLQGSLNEIQNIDYLLKKQGINSVKWTEYQALEDNFKKCGQYYPSPEIIHLSTHGYFKQSKSINPLFDSYLAFAGVQDVFRGGKALQDFEDGFLNAYEVVDLNLANTRLIVLSACDTGLGDINNSEGVYGLPRAFKLAGCDHVIMSLWQIPDQKTVEFMSNFYQNWLSGSDIRDAFQKTQRELKEKYIDPFYWAAFVLI